MFLFSERDKLIQINEYKKSIHILTIRMAAQSSIIEDLDHDESLDFVADYEREVEYICFMYEVYRQMELELIRLQSRLFRHRRTISADTIHQIASFL